MRQIKVSKNILNEASDNLSAFFRDINQYKILSSEEQITLAKKAKEGDLEARNKLVTHNLKFIVMVAKKYTGKGIPLMDLIQDGVEGLIQSLKKYDPSKGYKFLSFSVWYIRRQMLHSIYTSGQTIKHPINYIVRANKINKVVEKFISENKREPTEEELIELTDIKSKHIKSMQLDKCYCQSLDTPLTDDERVTVADTVAEDEDELRYDKDSILRCLKHLNKREYEVITKFYGLDGQYQHKIKEIAEDLNLGEERVRQLRKSGIKKLKDRCGNILKALL